MDENNLADVIKKVLDNEVIDEKCGNWLVNNKTDLSHIDLIYYNGLRPVMTYGFQVIPKKRFILFYNHQREAMVKREGIGTESLRQIEKAIRDYSKNTKNSSIIAFRLRNQEDTKKWLLKNQYESITDDPFMENIIQEENIYFKEIN
jgi:hypothetical protein